MDREGLYRLALAVLLGVLLGGIGGEWIPRAQAAESSCTVSAEWKSMVSAQLTQLSADVRALGESMAELRGRGAFNPGGPDS